MQVAAKGLVTAIARKTEIDECFQPKNKQGGGFPKERLEECLAALDKAVRNMAKRKDIEQREKSGTSTPTPDGSKYKVRSRQHSRDSNMSEDYDVSLFRTSLSDASLQFRM